MTASYNGIEITIDLPHGTFVFFNNSGIGKTFLASILNKLYNSGYRTGSYTYTDYKQGIPIELKLDNAKYDVVLLDRYDMYNGAGKNAILNFATMGTVMLDCKGIPPVKCGTCKLAYYQNILEVELL